MYEVLRLPLEEALAWGSDTRSKLDPHRRNKYGSATRPSRVIPFGSCTSSSPSARGFEAAGRLQDKLRRSRNPRQEVQTTVHTIRRRLRAALGIPSQVGIALAPSGTDAELIAVALAGGRMDRSIVNIVVGPNEVGSGTPRAAAGLYYDSLTPSGKETSVAAPIDEALAARIQLKVVPLRHDDGSMVEEAELDEQVRGLVEHAARQRAIILLHIVAHSKTGMHAPSLRCVEALRQRHEDLVIMVDAAQGRFSRKGMRQSLHQEHLFMLTGSKFFGGPPFSGALCVPQAWTRIAQTMPCFPAGFGDFFSAEEMPISWRSIRSGLPAEPNYGLLLRWAAALAEIEAYYHAPSEARLKVLRFFESEVPRVFTDSSAAELLAVYPPVYGEHRLLQSKTTVFNFRVRRPDGQAMDIAELKQLHGQLIDDVSADYPDADVAPLQQGFHLGQPVRIGKHGGALRIALGGELIVRVSTDASLGCTFEERLHWLQSQLVNLRTKVDLIVAAQQTSADLLNS